MLNGLVTADWGERYGRPVRLCSQPSHSVTRLTQADADARGLLARAGDRRLAATAGHSVRYTKFCTMIWRRVDSRGRLRPMTDRVFQGFRWR